MLEFVFSNKYRNLDEGYFDAYDAHSAQLFTFPSDLGDSERDRRLLADETLSQLPQTVALLNPLSAPPQLDSTAGVGLMNSSVPSLGPKAMRRRARGGRCPPLSRSLPRCWGVASVPSKRDVPGLAWRLKESGVLVLVKRLQDLIRSTPEGKTAQSWPYLCVFMAIECHKSEIRWVLWVLLAHSLCAHQWSSMPCLCHQQCRSWDIDARECVAWGACLGVCEHLDPKEEVLERWDRDSIGHTPIVLMCPVGVFRCSPTGLSIHPETSEKAMLATCATIHSSWTSSKPKERTYINDKTSMPSTICFYNGRRLTRLGMETVQVETDDNQLSSPR